jgi:plasmid stabilization system protein ParE
VTRRIVYAPRTLRDLEEVHAYLVDEAQNRTVADRFLSRLLAACTTLQTLPERFAAYPYARTWRMMPFGDYLVFFQVHANTVLIGHVRHAARRPFGG